MVLESVNVSISVVMLSDQTSAAVWCGRVIDKPYVLLLNMLCQTRIAVYNYRGTFKQCYRWRNSLSGPHMFLSADKGTVVKFSVLQILYFLSLFMKFYISTMLLQWNVNMAIVNGSFTNNVVMLYAKHYSECKQSKENTITDQPRL